MTNETREAMRERPALRCLDVDRSKCKGAVEWRPSLTGTGTNIPRCDRHWEERLNKDEEDRRNYPDSPIAPSWFDPMDAGERWDEDE